MTGIILAGCVALLGLWVAVVGVWVFLIPHDARAFHRRAALQEQTAQQFAADQMARIHAGLPAGSTLALLADAGRDLGCSLEPTEKFGDVSSNTVTCVYTYDLLFGGTDDPRAKVATMFQAIQSAGWSFMAGTNYEAKYRDYLDGIGSDIYFPLELTGPYPTSPLPQLPAISGTDRWTWIDLMLVTAANLDGNVGKGPFSNVGGANYVYGARLNVTYYAGTCDLCSPGQG